MRVPRTRISCSLRPSAFSLCTNRIDSPILNHPETIYHNCHLTNSLFVAFVYRLAPSTALKAEWEPPAGEKWEEKDYEAEIAKMEKEAEERLDAKIAEMMAKVETTGAN